MDDQHKRQPRHDHRSEGGGQTRVGAAPADDFACAFGLAIRDFLAALERG